MTTNLPVPLASKKKKNQLPSLTNRLSHGGAEFIDFLPGTLAVTEQSPGRWSGLIINLSVLFFVVAIVGACFAKVDRVVVTQGKVRPVGSVIEINHYFGGKITELNVQDGDLVQEGQVLMKLDPADVSQQVMQMRSRYNAVRAEVARLEAEAKGRGQPVFPDELEKTDPGLLANEISLFRSRMMARNDQRNALKSAVAQRQSDIDQYTSRTTGTSTELVLAEKQAAAARELGEKGYYPKLRVLQAERDVTALRREVDQATAGTEAAQGSLAEARARLAQFESDTRSEILTELAAKKLERDQSKAELDRLASQQNNLEIIAPKTGFVEKLVVKSAGQSIAANTVMMNIVPQSENYVIDVRVSDSDISSISVGQKARIKLSAFDYQRFGTLDGTVILKPSDSTVDQQSGSVFFTAVVKPVKNYLGSNPLRRRIQSGMTAEVDLHVGERTVISYLRNVVMRTADEAFRE